MNSKEIQRLLPERPSNSYKGSFGKVLVIVGSSEYPGAAVLSAKSVYRVGAGLVTVASSSELVGVYVKEFPETTHLRILEVLEKLGEYDVILVGPGVGQEKEVSELVNQLIRSKEIQGKKLVIDADGLNNLAKIERWWEKIGDETVLTPHPGEMSRLIDLKVEEIQARREEIAREFSKKWNKVVVLKGAETVVASPTNLVVSPFANPALATAGTGDVLAGIITGFLAQGLGSFDAAVVGVYVHGYAGDLWSKKHGDAGMLASDLIELLPEAIKKIKDD